MLINRSQMLTHVIFSTQNQQHFISEKIEPVLYDRISKILFDECYSRDRPRQEPSRVC